MAEQRAGWALWALVGAMAVLSSCPGVAAEGEAPASTSNAATAQELPQVIVIGNAPLPGLRPAAESGARERADRRQRRTCSAQQTT